MVDDFARQPAGGRLLASRARRPVLLGDKFALFVNDVEEDLIGQLHFGQRLPVEGQLQGTGRALGSAVTAYNRTVGSLEARVLVSARRLRELKVVEDELDVPKQVDAMTRPLSAPELVASAEEGNRLRPLPPPERSLDGREANGWGT